MFPADVTFCPFNRYIGRSFLEKHWIMKVKFLKLNNLVVARLMSLLGLAAAMLLTTACKKDGIYRPADKLSGISEYYEKLYQHYNSEKKQWETIRKDSTARQYTEKWLWNDKELQLIDVYQNGKKVSTVTFIYDGKRLARTNISYQNTYIEYEYDGSHLKTMTHKNKKGETMWTETFEYDGKRISSMTTSTTGTTTKAGHDFGHTLALQAVLGDATIARNIAENRRKNDGSKTTETIWDFEWKNDNIRSVTDRATGSKTTYRYDTKTNPLRSLLATMTGIGGNSNDYAFANRNNITVAESDGTKLSYSYTYSDDLPASRSQSIVDHYTQGYRYVETTIQYFEYVEE